MTDLVRDILRDLIADARCADRDNMPEYGAFVRRQIRILWPQRRAAPLDRYGWPHCMKA